MDVYLGCGSEFGVIDSRNKAKKMSEYILSKLKDMQEELELEYTRNPSETFEFPGLSKTLNSKIEKLSSFIIDYTIRKPEIVDDFGIPASRSLQKSISIINDIYLFDYLKYKHDVPYIEAKKLLSELTNNMQIVYNLIHFNA